jgi:hypothetical protein
LGQQVLHVTYTGKLENEAASKPGSIQFGQYSIPIDIAGTWSQMLISLAVIAVCVDHAQVLTQLCMTL